MKSMMIGLLGVALILSVNGVSAKPLPPDLVGGGKVVVKHQLKFPIPPVCLSCPPFDRVNIRDKVINPKIINPKLGKVNVQGLR